jgi:tRNA wybutosine-synthesizing protein 1
MLSRKLLEILKKQHYQIIGKHSAVQICRWTKKSLIDSGECYKARFYGIKSHLCCQMSPWLGCQNQCLHCWRAIELDFEKFLNKKQIDNPEFIIKESVKAQEKLLTGFKGNEKVNKNKLREAQTPEHFAISLVGEPTLYPKIGELIKELRKKGKTTFLVTNGLNPDVLSKLSKDRNLPTQLYISMNASNKKLYDKWHKSKEKDSWKKFNKSLEIMNKLKDKTRTVIRMTFVKDLNTNNPFKKGLTQNKDYVKEYAKLIKKASPDFVEVKGFMSVGFSRKRLGYEKMPRHELIKEFSKKLVRELPDYKILDEYELSAVVLIGKDKEKMRIKRGEV